MKTQKLIIFPFNGNGREALDCLDPELFECIGFVDDDFENKKQRAGGIPVYGREFISKYPEAKVLAVPGSASSFRERNQVIDSLQLPAEKFATILHPSVVKGRDVHIGYNSLVMAGTVLTSNCFIGNHVCILPNSVIHHDTRIGDFTLVGSGVCVGGGTHIGENCYIASGSTIIHGIHIGSMALVGLASNVIRDITSNARVVGNPAREIHSGKTDE